MITVVATVQRGRRAHLDRQIAALAESSLRPAAHVVVSMDRTPPQGTGCDVVRGPFAEAGSPLPVAAARNAAIRHASREHGAHLVVMLDVDCLPAPMMLGRYVRAARTHPGLLLAGAVHYLAAGVPASGPLPSTSELASSPPHPARPAPPAGTVLLEPRLDLFWSLSFAVSPRVHQSIGGFDEAYEGYGAEDTDYACRAQRGGVGLAWVGGADAYHQHHPVSSPPVEHLTDIVRNARRFHARWSRWPMLGWLSAFRDQGLIDWELSGRHLALTAQGQAVTRAALVAAQPPAAPVADGQGAPR